MGKSTSVYQTTEINDASQVQGLQAVRGDGNTVNTLDAGAISQAYQFAGRNSDGMYQTVADIQRGQSDAWTKLMDTAQKTNQQVFGLLSKSTADTADTVRQSIAAVQAGQDSANANIKPQNMLLILAALAALVLLGRRGAK